MAKIENAEVVKFWMRKHIRDLEARAAAPSQVEMAQTGLSYAARQSELKRAEARAEDLRKELESLREAYRFICDNAE